MTAGSRPAGSRAPLVALAAGAALFGLALAAILLQLLWTPEPLQAGWRSDRFFPSVELNQLGFRGHPIDYDADDFVVLLVGDSQVEAEGCAHDWMPERRLEHHLREMGGKARVFSLGTQGYGQDQQLLAVEEYLKRFRADLILVWMTPGNDIWNNQFPTHFGTPKPTFWLEDGNLRGPNWSMGSEIRCSSINLIELLCREFRPPDWDEEWEARLPPAYQPMIAYEGQAQDEWQVQWDEDFPGARRENMETGRNHRAILLTPRSPRMTYGLDLTRALLESMRSAVGAYGGDLAVFWQVYEDLAPARMSKEHVFVLNGLFYRISEGQGPKNMEYLLSGLEHHVVRVSLAKWRMGPADSHLNQHAVDEMMHSLAMRIVGRLPRMSARPAN